MAVRFKCVCGHELTAEDADAKNEVKCPSCGRTQPVPDPDPKAGADQVAQFDSTLDDFDHGQSVPPPSPGQGEIESTLDDFDHGQSAPPPPPGQGKIESTLDDFDPTQLKPSPAAPAEDIARDETTYVSKSGLRTSEALKVAGLPPGIEDKQPTETDAEQKQVAGEELPEPAAPPAAGPIGDYELEGDESEAVVLVADEVVLVTDEDEGETAKESEGQADKQAVVDVDKRKPLRITVHRVLGDKVKFTCECGKRITAPLHTKKKIGTCPRCRRRLILPKPGPKTVVEPKRRFAAAGTAVTCPHCGVPTPGGAAKFCVECGKPLASKGPTESTPPAPLSAGAKAADVVAQKLRRPRAAAYAPGQPASVGLRLLAGLIEIAALMVVLILAALAFKASGYQGVTPWLVGLAAMLSVAVLNDIVLLLATQKTFGKVLTGLVVIRTDGSPLDFSHALLRFLLKYSGMPGVLYIFLDPDRRAVHDHISDSYVVRGSK